MGEQYEAEIKETNGQVYGMTGELTSLVMWVESLLATEGDDICEVTMRRVGNDNVSDV